MNDAEIKAQIDSIPHWHHQIEIRPGIVTPGRQNSRKLCKTLEIPEDCTGLKVLDLGARDGYFSFEMERRGAEVVAVDYFPPELSGFKVAKELLNSNVTFTQENIYNISKEKYGEFDIVLFLGLIYHLPDPMLALKILRSVCKGKLYLESYVIDEAVLLPNGKKKPLRKILKEPEIALMQFFPSDSLDGDYTNYWGPNMKCLELMLIESNFEVLDKKTHNDRGIFTARAVSDKVKEYHSEIARGIIKNN